MKLIIKTVLIATFFVGFYHVSFSQGTCHANLEELMIKWKKEIQVNSNQSYEQIVKTEIVYNGGNKANYEAITEISYNGDLLIIKTEEAEIFIDNTEEYTVDKNGKMIFKTPKKKKPIAEQVELYAFSQFSLFDGSEEGLKCKIVKYNKQKVVSFIYNPDGGNTNNSGFQYAELLVDPVNEKPISISLVFDSNSPIKSTKINYLKMEVVTQFNEDGSTSKDKVLDRNNQLKPVYKNFKKVSF